MLYIPVDLRNEVVLPSIGVQAWFKSSSWTRGGPVTHICVSKLDYHLNNGLSPIWRQVTSQCWLIDGTLKIKLLWNSNKNIKPIVQNMHFKISSEQCWPFCLGVNVLNFNGSISTITNNNGGSAVPQSWKWKRRTATVVVPMHLQLGRSRTETMGQK